MMDVYEFFDESFTKKFGGEYFLAGIDEVGRGPLAGPVVSACVYLHVKKGGTYQELKSYLSDLAITDSKKLSIKKRETTCLKFFPQIEAIEKDKVYLFELSKNVDLKISLAEVLPEEIDRINILNASLKAMAQAFSFCHVSTCQGTVLVDGNIVPKDIEVYGAESIVKGDQKSLLIGLSSIVAKVYRDHLMKVFGVKYPQYGLEKHAGYPTSLHKKAISLYGPSPIHRKSFAGVKDFV